MDLSWFIMVVLRTGNTMIALRWYWLAGPIVSWLLCSLGFDEGSSAARFCLDKHRGVPWYDDVPIEEAWCICLERTGKFQCGNGKVKLESAIIPSDLTYSSCLKDFRIWFMNDCISWHSLSRFSKFSTTELSFVGSILTSSSWRRDGIDMASLERYPRKEATRFPELPK